jgi:hypothetical protein
MQLELQLVCIIVVIAEAVACGHSQLAIGLELRNNTLQSFNFISIMCSAVSPEFTFTALPALFELLQLKTCLPGVSDLFHALPHDFL